MGNFRRLISDVYSQGRESRLRETRDCIVCVATGVDVAIACRVNLVGKTQQSCRCQPPCKTAGRSAAAATARAPPDDRTHLCFGQREFLRQPADAGALILVLHQHAVDILIAYGLLIVFAQIALPGSSGHGYRLIVACETGSRFRSIAVPARKSTKNINHAQPNLPPTQACSRQTPDECD